ncbi:hypothetical protein NYP18_01740 [Corynebacterium sp. YIM 101645]|uniref:Uncharacterized protein n=1 Tax=Corynebacterium lemuris TaxID=1859292 RepID=A0ABT2FU91_9CORY|nr:hypothetical protein [Corynebacterium lemuris]MCS5478370.1 hypothetical protein [Corynebacterium lemuris]
MSDKQLTVAELLARAGREKEGEETPRRRRRSLEEGGISVAELTGSIPAVKEKPVESKHSSVPIDGPEPESRPEPETGEEETTPEPEESTPATDQTVVLDKVGTELPEPEPESAPEQTGVIAPVDAPEEPEEPEAEDVDAQLAGEETSGVEEKTSLTGVILMTAIGVVLGVVIFKGFEMLWESFSRPVVAILAVLVTAGMVGVVKALRTTNDALSMVLAGFVGLLMTFGPLAIVML